jgi:type II secretory pathway component PulF
MPQFKYVAKKPNGQLIDGVLTCNDRAAAIFQVEQQGGVPIKIEAVAAAASAAPEPKAAAKAAKTSTTPATRPSKGVEKTPAKTLPPGSVSSLSHAHQHLFTEQLAHLLGAGMTLDEALGVLEKRLKQPKLHSLSQGLHRALVDGRSLSQALKDYPKIFSPLYVNLVSAGEASGALPEILKRLVRHLAAVKDLRDRVSQALLYPSVLVVAGIVLIIVFMTVMVPKLTDFFKGTGQPLPAATRLLVDANWIITHYWWLGLLIGGLGYGVWKSFTSTAEGRRAWDYFTWRIPLYSRIIRYRFYAQFARTLGTLMENGVTLLRSLELLQDISGNEHVRLRMIEIRKAVVDGATLSVAMGEQGIFPELFVDMMAVGEQTGRFGGTMQMVADVYERELDQQIQVVSTLIPPLVMIVIAALVGLVVYGIMSAVFGLTSGLRAGVR